MTKHGVHDNMINEDGATCLVAVKQEPTEEERGKEESFSFDDEEFLGMPPKLAAKEVFPPGCKVQVCLQEGKGTLPSVLQGTVVEVGVNMSADGNRETLFKIQLISNENPPPRHPSSSSQVLMILQETNLQFACRSPVWFEAGGSYQKAMVVGSHQLPVFCQATKSLIMQGLAYSVQALEGGFILHHGVAPRRVRFRSTDNSKPPRKLNHKINSSQKQEASYPNATGIDVATISPIMERPIAKRVSVPVEDHCDETNTRPNDYVCDDNKHSTNHNQHPGYVQPSRKEATNQTAAASAAAANNFSEINATNTLGPDAKDVTKTTDEETPNNVIPNAISLEEEQRIQEANNNNYEVSDTSSRLAHHASSDSASIVHKNSSAPDSSSSPDKLAPIPTVVKEEGFQPTLNENKRKKRKKKRKEEDCGTTTTTNDSDASPPRKKLRIRLSLKQSSANKQVHSQQMESPYKALIKGGSTGVEKHDTDDEVIDGLRALAGENDTMGGTVDDPSEKGSSKEVNDDYCDGPTERGTVDDDEKIRHDQFQGHEVEMAVSYGLNYDIGGATDGSDAGTAVVPQTTMDDNILLSQEHLETTGEKQVPEDAAGLYSTAVQLHEAMPMNATEMGVEKPQMKTERKEESMVSSNQQPLKNRVISVMEDGPCPPQQSLDVVALPHRHQNRTPYPDAAPATTINPIRDAPVTVDYNDTLVKTQVVNHSPNPFQSIIVGGGHQIQAALHQIWKVRKVQLGYQFENDVFNNRCLKWHLVGRCSTTCQRINDHVPLSSELAKTLEDALMPAINHSGPIYCHPPTNSAPDHDPDRVEVNDQPNPFRHIRVGKGHTIRAAVLQLSDFRKARGQNGLGSSLNECCLKWHLIGRCRSGCRYKEDHISLTRRMADDMEDALIPVTSLSGPIFCHPTSSAYCEDGRYGPDAWYPSDLRDYSYTGRHEHHSRSTFYSTRHDDSSSLRYYDDYESRHSDSCRDSRSHSYEYHPSDDWGYRERSQYY